MALDKGLLEEIDAAVDETTRELNATTPEDAPEDAPEDTPEDAPEDASEVTAQVTAQVDDEVDDEVDDDEKDKKAEEPESDVLPSMPLRSEALLERAVRNGLSLADAKAFPSDNALQSTCESLEQIHASAEEQGEVEDPLAVFEKLNTEDFQPEVVEFLGTLVGQMRAQREEIRQLRSGQEQSVQVRQEAVVREVETWFDGQVASLGDSFQEALGTGGYRSLAPGSSQLQQRDAIAEQMAVQMAGYQAVGKPMPPREELFVSAARIVLSSEFAALERKQIQKELRRRSKQHIQRGTRGDAQGGETGLSPEDEAAQKLERKYFGKG